MKSIPWDAAETAFSATISVIRSISYEDGGCLLHMLHKCVSEKALLWTALGPFNQGGIFHLLCVMCPIMQINSAGKNNFLGKWLVLSLDNQHLLVLKCSNPSTSIKLTRKCSTVHGSQGKCPQRQGCSGMLHAFYTPHPSKKPNTAASQWFGTLAAVAAQASL